jgi:predicted transcriptional regulator
VSKLESVTTEVDTRTMEIVRSLARARGVTGEQFVAEAVRRVAESEANLDAFLKTGEEDIARGDFVEHDILIANLRRWRETRTRPS